MKKVSWAAVILVASILSISSAQAEEWITEEVLKQLSEVRQELKALKEEVRGLKQELANKPAARPASKGAPLDIDGAPFIGEEDAEYAIVEFSDYQCPYCRRHFNQTLPQIEQNYVSSGKVKYVMKQFPLGFHAEARGASIAALCVDRLKPGNYWQVHKSIFAGETELAIDSYRELAGKLNINPDNYNSCLQDPEVAARVDQDMREGESVGVSGTPAFYIGKIVDGKVVDGQLVTGARPYSSFVNVLDRLL